MKKLIIILCLFCIPLSAEAFLGKVVGSIVGGIGSIFTGGSKTELKVGTKETTNVETNVDNRELISIGKKMDKLLEMNIKAEAKLTGIDNTVNGNVTVTNDPKILKWIIYGLCSIIGLLVRSIFADRKLARVERTKRDEHIQNIQKSKDDWKNRLLEMLLKKAGVINGKK